MGSDALVVTIPGTPDKCLSPNAVRRERHWAPRHKATKQARGDAFYATMCELGANQSARTRKANSLHAPLTLHAVIAWEKGRRAYDPDNAHAILKATIDGIADAIGVNDKHITLATVQQDRDPEGRGFVKIAIESTADERKTA